MAEIKTMHDHHMPVLKLKHESGNESVHYPLIYEEFPEEFKRIAERELNETDENRKKCLQRLRDFMERENLTFVEDYVLMAVLRCCKFNLKKSEVKLKNFLKKRRELIEMLMEIDTDKIQNILDDFGFGILPYRDNHGRAIFYTRPYGLDLEKYETHDVGVVGCVAALFALKYPIQTVAGYNFFGECKSPSLYLFYPMLRSLKQMIFILLPFPIRVGRIEILNENYVCRCFYNMLSPILSKKIFSRVALHGPGYDNLHKLYDPNMLPEEFGGNLGPLNNETYRQKLLDFVTELKNGNV